MNITSSINDALISSEPNPSTLLKVAVLVSGNGSNLQVLIDAMQAGELPIQIVGVISNNNEAFAITRAKQANINTTVLSHIKTDDNAGKRMGIKTFEHYANQKLNEWRPDLIVLAGFMRVLSADFIDSAPAPMINLHPSLLPKYKGLNTHQRALEAGDTHHGCSVHVVTAELDAGQLLTQAVLEIDDNDDSNTLQSKVQKIEHLILPWTILLIAKGAIDINTLQHDPKSQSLKYLPALPLKLLFN